MVQLHPTPTKEHMRIGVMIDPIPNCLYLNMILIRGFGSGRQKITALIAGGELGVALEKVRGRGLDWGWIKVFVRVISYKELLVCRCQVRHGSGRR